MRWRDLILGRARAYSGRVLAATSPTFVPAVTVGFVIAGGADDTQGTLLCGGSAID